LSFENHDSMNACDSGSRYPRRWAMTLFSKRVLARYDD